MFNCALKLPGFTRPRRAYWSPQRKLQEPIPRAAALLLRLSRWRRSGERGAEESPVRRGGGHVLSSKASTSRIWEHLWQCQLPTEGIFILSRWPDTRFSLCPSVCLSVSGSIPPSSVRCLPCAHLNPSPLPEPRSSPAFSEAPFLPRLLPLTLTIPGPCSAPGQLVGPISPGKLTLPPLSSCYGLNVCVPSTPNPCVNPDHQSVGIWR